MLLEYMGGTTGVGWGWGSGRGHSTAGSSALGLRVLPDSILKFGVGRRWGLRVHSRRISERVKRMSGRTQRWVVIRRQSTRPFGSG